MVYVMKELLESGVLNGGRGCRTGRHERSESCTERGEAENGAITWLMSRGGENPRAKG